MTRAMAAGDLGAMLAVGAGVAAGAWFLTRSGRRPSSPIAAPAPVAVRAAIAANDNRPATTVSPPSPTGMPPGRWVWPLPRWQGRAPVISDGWGSPRDGGARRHRGVDVMYRRRFLDEHALAFPPRPPHSKWHFLPPGTVALAAAYGKLWSAGKTSRGYTVVISHGRPWATYYTHLSSLLVPETEDGRGDVSISVGQPLGEIGVDPTNPKIAHLHFAIWKGGAEESAIDPAPILDRLPVIDAPRVDRMAA